MPLPMARNPTRSSSPKSCRFPLGSSVEVRSTDLGFEGAWYEAKITQIPRPNHRRYVVTYSTLVVDDSNTPLKESVYTIFMRPRPPIELHSNDVFGLHQLVEAFHNEGWWPGVVSKLPSSGDGLYSVCFPTSREEFVFKSLELRRLLEWVKGKWVSVEDCLLGDKEGGHVMFGEGTPVEVSRDRENFGAAWFVGIVVKYIGRTYFLVEYKNIKVDRESGTEYPLKEIVDLQYIRPCPPMSESSTYDVLDELEVFYEDGWYFGVVLVVLPGSRYVVKYKHREEDMTVHHTALRPHLVWTDGQWHLVSKDNDKEVADGSDISSRTGKKRLESGDEFSRPLKMLKKPNMPEEHSHLVGEIKSDIQTSRKGKSRASEHSVHLVPMLTSSNNDGEIANKKVTKPRFDEDNSPQHCTGDENCLTNQGISLSYKQTDTMEDSHVLPEIEPSIPGAKLPACSVLELPMSNSEAFYGKSEEIRICADKHTESTKLVQTIPLIEDMVLIPCGSVSDKVPEIPMVALGPPCNGSSLSIFDNVCNEKEFSPVRLLSEKAFVEAEVEDSRSIRLRKDGVAALHDMVNIKESETALIDPNSMESSSKKMILSLSKMSEMSELVEPALNILPQQPHFRPLLKHGKELREGLACGLMTAFASLVTGLCNLRILDSEQDFEEKLEVLNYLEKHGFNVQPVQVRLEKLLEIRNMFGQLEEKKNFVVTQVKELEEVKGKDDLFLSELEKSVVELEERLACIQEERSSVILKIKKNESEITNLKAVVQATEEKNISVKLQFDASATAPW